jgi:hypothetical protein
LFLKALGGARPHSYLLLVQKKRIKEKDTRRLARFYRKGFPALLALSGARELFRAIPGAHPLGAASGDNWAPALFFPPCGRSDIHALHPEMAAMLGGVTGIGCIIHPL